MWTVVAALLLLPACAAHGQRLHSVYTSIANHFTYKGGGGLTSPVGGTGAIMNEGWNVEAGAGYRLDRWFSLPVEWQLMRTGMGNSLLNYDLVSSGSYHIWTASLDPTVTYLHRGKFTGYVLGGGGYSHTRTNYTGPAVGSQCSLICSCYNNCATAAPTAPGTYHTTSSQPMADVGLGFTMRPFGQHRYQIYTEARYINLYEGSNVPPYKNVGTIPLTAGIQW